MGRHSKGDIWAYFDNVVEEGMAVCKTCQQRLKNNRTFNLRTHMRKVHDFDIDVPETNTTQSYSAQTFNEEQISSMLKVAKRKMHEDRNIQQEKRPKKRIVIELEEKNIVRSIMGLIIEDGLAPKIFDSRNLQALIKPTCDVIAEQGLRGFKVNSSKTERSLSQVANHIRNLFSNDLHWRLLSLKIDTDMNATSFRTFCVSAQFVNEGHIENRVLGVIDLEDESQFSENHIIEILHKFNIDTKQIVAACWDNTKERFMEPVKNFEFIEAIDDFEKYPDIFLGDVKVERYIGFIAQLCVLDIFKNTNIFQPYMECRNLTKYLNDKSNGYYQLLEANNLRVPQLDSPWKWGSAYRMIYDLNLARVHLQNVKFEKLECPEDHFSLNEQFWSFAEAFSKALSFMQKSVMRFYSEEQHYGDFYAQWLKSKLLTEKLLSSNNNENKFISLIATELLKSIEKRSKELLDQARFDASLYLDPRFHHTLNLQQKANALEYLKQLWCRAKIYNSDVLNTTCEPETCTQQQFDDDEDAFLNDFLSQNMQTKDAATADVYARIERLKLPFQMVDTNILFFWRELKYSEPHLHALSSICFGMPATQIYNEVRYSHFITFSDSANISRHTKENILFIRLNAHVMDDAIDQVVSFRDEESKLLAHAPLEEDEGPTLPVKHEVTDIDSSSQASLTTNIDALPTTTAIITSAGTAILPPNIIIKPITTTT